MATVRIGRFIEGSMNDKPSAKPPSIFTRITSHNTAEAGAGVPASSVDTMMEDYHTEASKPAHPSSQKHKRWASAPSVSRTVSSATAETDSTGGLSRLGRSFAATLNPVAIWQKVATHWNEARQEILEEDEAARKKALLDERAARAKEAYAQFKRSGGADKHGVRVPGPAPGRRLDKHAGHPAASAPDLADMAMEDARASSVDVTRHSGSSFLVPSLPTPLLPFARGEKRAHSPGGADSRPRKKDVQRRQRLEKRVSDLEGKLNAARRELKVAMSASQLRLLEEAALEEARAEEERGENGPASPARPAPPHNSPEPAQICTLVAMAETDVAAQDQPKVLRKSASAVRRKAVPGAAPTAATNPEAIQPYRMHSRAARSLADVGATIRADATATSNHNDDEDGGEDAAAMKKCASTPALRHPSSSGGNTTAAAGVTSNPTSAARPLRARRSLGRASVEVLQECDENAVLLLPPPPPPPPAASPATLTKRKRVPAPATSSSAAVAKKDANEKGATAAPGGEGDVSWEEAGRDDGDEDGDGGGRADPPKRKLRKTRTAIATNTTTTAAVLIPPRAGRDRERVPAQRGPGRCAPGPGRVAVRGGATATTTTSPPLPTAGKSARGAGDAEGEIVVRVAPDGENVPPVPVLPGAKGTFRERMGERGTRESFEWPEDVF